MFKKLITLYKKYQEVINYLIFGFLTTLVSIISYWIFTRIFEINYNVSNVFSWILAVTFAFFTNKFCVFKNKDSSILKSGTKFFISRITTLVIEIIIMFVMVDVIKINDMISKFIAQVVIIILNYLFSKLFVFKNKTSLV